MFSLCSKLASARSLDKSRSNQYYVAAKLSSFDHKMLDTMYRWLKFVAPYLRSVLENKRQLINSGKSGLYREANS